MKLPEFFGLDIGNHSVKLAQVKFVSKDSAELVKISKLSAELNVIKSEDLSPLAEKIKQLVTTAKISSKKVVIALPESLVFSRLIVTPDIEETKMEQMLFFEAKQYLPLPPEEVQMEWIPINKFESNGQKMQQVLLVAAPKKIIQKYIDLMKLAGLEILAIETESVATSRAYTFNRSFQEGVLILDFGGTNTDISVVKNKSVIFSQSIGTGSDVLTKAIATEFSLDDMQAEEYKKTYGLLKDQAQGKIYNALNPVMNIIVTEINKTLNYFREHLRENTPKELFIVGDGANLPGLPEYLTERLKIPAQVQDPVNNLILNENIKAEVAQIPTVGFTVAIGLALKTE